MKKITKLLVVSLVVLLMGVGRVNAATSAEKLNELFGKIKDNINQVAIKILDPELVGSTDILAQSIEAAISQLSAVNSFISENISLAKFSDIKVECESFDSCVVKVGENSYPIPSPSELLEKAGEINDKVQEIITGQFTQNEDGSYTANYNLFDMDFINFMYNNVQGSMEGIMNLELNTIYNYFPELQSINEALENKYNAWFEGGTDATTVGGVVKRITAPFIAYYNEIMSKYGEGTFNFAPIILVGKGTSELEYIQEAQKRIEEYLGESKINVNLEKIEEEVTDSQQLEISNFLKGAGVVSVEYTSYKAKLTIGTKSFDVYVVKVDEKVVKDLYTAISTSVMYNDVKAMLTTTGVDVPADVQLFIEDVSAKFKDSEIFDWVVDINLYSESMGRYITKTDNGFEIKIPVNSDFVKEGHSIWYVLEGELKEKIPSFDVITDENGQKYAVFTVTHLSEYAGVNNAKADSLPGDTQDPDTQNPEGEPPSGFALPYVALGTITLVAIGAMIYMKKKNLIKNI